jgi:carbon storage regulator
MLVLSRKEGEKITIGEEIEITICRIVGGRVKVGLRAPEGMRILRGEIAADQSHWERDPASRSTSLKMLVRKSVVRNAG